MKHAKFWAIPQVGTGTQTGVVPVPLNKTKVVPILRQSGTGTNMKNRVGIGTTASYSPNFWYSYIVKLKFARRGYMTPNKLLMGIRIRMKLSEQRIVSRRC